MNTPRPSVNLSEEERRRVERIERLADEAGPAGVHALVEQLADPSWSVRRWVVAALARLGDAATPALCELLAKKREDESQLAAAVDALVASSGAPEEQVLALAYHDHPHAVADAAQILGRRRSVAGIPVLVQLTGHPDDNVAVAAIEALGRVGGRAAVDSLIVAVKSRRFFRTFPAIDVLGRSGDPRAIEPLAELLDESAYAFEAARALGRTGDRAAVPPLARLLLRPSDAMVRVASLALAELSERHADRYGSTPVFAETLRRAVPVDAAVRRLMQCLGGADVAEQLAICRLLGALGSEAAIPALVRLLDGPTAAAACAAQGLKRLGRESDAELLDALREGDSARRRVVLPLVAARSSAIDEVTRCLEDTDPVVRAMAADALGRIGNPAAAKRLFRQLEDPNPAVAQAVVGAIQSLGGDEVQPLALAAARSGSAHVRRSALRILAYFGFSGSLDALVEATQDPDERIRHTAIYGLPYIESPRALEALLTAARNESPRTRAAAMRALGHVPSDLRATSLLLKGLTDRDPWVRYYACQSLGRLAFEPAAELIADLLDDEAGQVRVAAVEALSHLESGTAFEALGRAARSREVDVRRAALLGLGIGKRREAVPILLEATRSADMATRLVAVSAIAGFDAPEVLPALVAAASDEDESVRNAAIGFLAAIPSAEATVRLAELVPASPARERLLAALSLATEGRLAGILAALETADDETAPVLTSALARMHRGDANRALTHALSLRSPAARKAAATTLAGIGTRDAIAALQEAAERDPDPEVRRICVVALAQ